MRPSVGWNFRNFLLDTLKIGNLESRRARHCRRVWACTSQPTPSPEHGRLCAAGPLSAAAAGACSWSRRRASDARQVCGANTQTRVSDPREHGTRRRGRLSHRPSPPTRGDHPRGWTTHRPRAVCPTPRNAPLPPRAPYPPNSQLAHTHTHRAAEASLCTRGFGTPRPPAPGAWGHARLFESGLRDAPLGLVHVLFDVFRALECSRYFPGLS